MSSIVSEKSLQSSVLDHLYIAGPVCFSFVMRKSVDIVSVIFVGHLGAHFLSSAGLASVTANVTGNSMIIGLAGAMTTLCSQANGANDMKELCLALQRAILILTVFLCLPVSCLWFFSEPIMVSLGQQPSIAKDASIFMRALIPGLWAMAFSACIQNWLYSMAKTKALAWITLSLALLHPLTCYCYIVAFKLGFIGAAMAASTTKILEFLFLLLYLNVFSTVLKDTQFKLSRECFSNWWPFLRLGLPNLLMMSEWWASEIIIFMAGSLANPEVQVSAMSIYQTLLSICFMFPSGFRVSGETIVGNALGANSSSVAKRASRIAPTLCFIVTTLIAISMVSTSRVWGAIFTDDERVVDLVSSIMPILGFYIVVDGLQASLTGILKGMGKQRIAGPIVVFVYYGIGIPISAWLALGKGVRWGVYGLCVGTLAGTVMHFVLYAAVVYGTTDWEKEAELVQERQKLQQSQQVDKNNFSSSDTGGFKALHGKYSSVRKDDTEDDTSDEESWLSSFSLSSHGGSVEAPFDSEGNRKKTLIDYVYLSLASLFQLEVKEQKSEFQLIRLYTDSLNPLRMDELDDEDEEVVITL